MGLPPTQQGMFLIPRGSNVSRLPSGPNVTRFILAHHLVEQLAVMLVVSDYTTIKGHRIPSKTFAHVRRRINDFGTCVASL